MASTLKEPSGADAAMQLLAAQQRIGELRAKLAQREAAIRELCRRLNEVEQPFWERTSKVEEELDAALQTIVELELTIHTKETMGLEGVIGADCRVAQLQGEIEAIHATRTFRYTAGARGLFSKARYLARRLSRAWR